MKYYIMFFIMLGVAIKTGFVLAFLGLCVLCFVLGLWLDDLDNYETYHASKKL